MQQILLQILRKAAAKSEKIPRNPRGTGISFHQSSCALVPVAVVILATCVCLNFHLQIRYILIELVISINFTPVHSDLIKGLLSLTAQTIKHRYQNSVDPINSFHPLFSTLKAGKEGG